MYLFLNVLKGMLHPIHKHLNSYIHAAPGIAELASNDNWASEFLSADRIPDNSGWSEEYMVQKPGMVPHANLWAEEYLDHSEHRAWYVNN